MNTSSMSMLAVSWLHWTAAQCNHTLSRVCPKCEGLVIYEYHGSKDGRIIAGSCGGCGTFQHLICETALGRPVLVARGLDLGAVSYLQRVLEDVALPNHSPIKRHGNARGTARGGGKARGRYEKSGRYAQSWVVLPGSRGQRSVEGVESP